MPLRCLVLLAACVAVSAVADSSLEPVVRDVLAHHLKFGPAELAEVDRGRIVRHSLGATAPGEVAVAGAIRINTTRDRFINHVRDIVRFKKAPEVLQVGRFSQPPAPGDLDALTLTAADFDPRSCRRVGACDVRLSADAIGRIGRELDMNAPDVQARGAALFKQLMLEHVTAYVSGHGNRITQHDGGPSPIRPLDEFAALLANSTAIGALVPGLADHLRDFPNRRVSGAEDFLYWTKQKFPSATVISVTHVTIVCAIARTCVVTTKDVYSSRYLDASLALTIATDGADPNSIYVVYANRSRANALKGLFSGLRRAIAERRTRASVEENLKAVKIELEKGS
jgi:hypothetical protein